MTDKDIIGVVIPCFKVKDSILGVLSRIGPEVTNIYVVDDACPEYTGNHVMNNCTDSRIKIIRHESNQGVGGAVISGYKAAIADNIDVIVKIDGDNQMDPSLLPEFVVPILNGESDYTKGNRFFNPEAVRAMPKLRLLGNAILSFMTKLSTGYWNLFDPTNGYTAIQVEVLKQLPLDKISKGYFFETDMLFRLNTLGCVVLDVPMNAVYENEGSSLKITQVIGEFSVKHILIFLKRIFYNYYLRDLSLASFQLPIGLGMLLFGLYYGSSQWIASYVSNTVTPAGTVMLSALPILMGMQFLLAFIGSDIASVPSRPISRSLRIRKQNYLMSKNSGIINEK